MSIKAINIALYKLPFSTHYTAIESEREALFLPDYAHIGEQSGFIVSPFSVQNGDNKIVLIRPDKVSEHPIPVLQPEESIAEITHQQPTEAYRNAFEAFHTAVSSRQFNKLVLARKAEVGARKLNAEALFLKACAMYPRQFVALVSTPATGTWLVCTPEILLSARNNTFSTMALAGTMPWEDGKEQWNAKNRAEQKVVADYMEQSLSEFASHIERSETYSKRAGNLAHLCTDFTFTPHDSNALGKLINALHPTPAVCGMPKTEALSFILDNEPDDRKYYSGFMGPVLMNHETHLYVSLRCAQLQQNAITLYSGGGIMPDSDLFSEWQETERKMQTIMSLGTQDFKY